VNDGKINFLEALKEYAEKAKIMKEIFLKNGFYIVYKEKNEELADGFYFTVAYPEMTSSQLMKNFLYYGLSAISLSITGSKDNHGLRICVSFVRPDQIPVLDKRLKEFAEDMKKNV
jgi:DNA-binding transcriptional MocR family regulator